MTFLRIPNVRVWSVARDYLEAAEQLLDANRLAPAVILAGLSNEIFLKSFLAKQDERGFVETERGHALTDLFGRIAESDRFEIERSSMDIDDKVDLLSELNRFDRAFTQTRYRYEKQAQSAVSSDVIYFSRHLSNTVFHLGLKRGI
jgi:HEPN domain-containing protein